MIALLLAVLTSYALAVDVVVTLPWLGSITEVVAPDAEITVLARGTEDPHTLSPTPALMAKVRDADLYVENGMGLELWSERVLDGAGNPRIRRGQPGHVTASADVPRLELPTELTRSRGDLHAEGNPHIWLDPLNIPIVAQNLAAGLARVDPANADTYRANAAQLRATVHERMFGADLVGFMGGDLLERLARSGKLRDFLAAKQLDGRLGGWLKQAESLDGKPIVFYHQSWAYFVDRFGLTVVGYVEDRPGIAPSAAHRAALEAAMKRDGCGVIGVTVYYDDRLAQVLGKATGARVVRLPSDVGGTDAASDWFALIDTLIAEIAH